LITNFRWTQLDNYPIVRLTLLTIFEVFIKNLAIKQDAKKSNASYAGSHKKRLEAERYLQ